WIRWMITGIASPARPTRNSGVRNDISPNPGQPLARRQIAEQRVVERLRRIDNRVIDAIGREALLQPVDVRADERAILIRERLRHDWNLFSRLEILERRRRVEREIELRRIQHMEHDDVAAPEPQRTNCFQYC